VTWHPFLISLVSLVAVVGSLPLMMAVLSVTSYWDWDERTRPDS
jgi:hypothetical protein